MQDAARRFDIFSLFPSIVINSQGEREKFDLDDISRKIRVRTGLDPVLSRVISDQVVKKIIAEGKKEILSSHIKELVFAEMTCRGLDSLKSLFNFNVKKFFLDAEFLENFKGKQPEWGSLGYITYKRTYARQKDDGTKEEFWETAKRVVEGCFTILATHCQSLEIPWDASEAQYMAQKMFEKIWNFKFLPPGRGLWIMGTDHVFRHGSMALNNCFAGDTEIITGNGIKKIKDCAGTTQKLLTINREWVDAPIREFGKQVLMRITLTRNGIEKEIYATPDHRWFFKTRQKIGRDGAKHECTTMELQEGYIIPYMFSNGIKNLRASPFGVAHGICFGDGNEGHLYLCSEKKKELVKFFPLNEKLDDPNKCEGGAIRISNLPRFFKEKPSLSENTNYLYGWLAGYFAADGSCMHDGGCVITSSKKENLLFVQDVCTLIGIGYYTMREETKISNLTNEPSTLYSLRLIPSMLCEDFFLRSDHKSNFINGESQTKEVRYWKVKSVESTDRVENVFCAVVDEKHAFTIEGNILTGNCAFISTKNIEISKTKPFEFMMDASMLGVGVGFDTKGAGTILVKQPAPGTYQFVVPDTREGWVECLHRVLAAFFDGTQVPEFDFSLVRPKGTPIKGFGGIASGPEPLSMMCESLIKMLNGKIDNYLTSVDIVDIMNYIGKCVVSGNVRRSAQIALGSPDDHDYVTMKDPALHSNEMMDRRWASNNSVIIDPDEGFDYTEIADSIAKNGEPGIVWLKNAQAYSRMNGNVDWKDKSVAGVNPCGEQSLESGETCCLVETFPSRHDTRDEFIETLKYAYLYAKSVTLMRTHWQETNAVMLKNRRIGTSLSGIIDAIAKHGRRTFLRWCEEGYAFLRNLDDEYSDRFCVPRSIKITTVKPSGTTSLLPGVSPGIHYPHSEYYIRRMRMASNSELLGLLKNAGYRTEKDVASQDTMIVEFPIKTDNFLCGKDDVSMEMQVMNAIDLQKYWSDNQVSITVTFKKSEAKHIKEILQTCEDKLKGISFLPLSEHGYVQAPYEEITREEYEKRVSELTVIDLASYIAKAEGVRGCDGDHCEL